MVSECYGIAVLIFALLVVNTFAEVNIKVSSVSKACSNFNCHLQWEAPSGFKCSKRGDDGTKDEKDRLTYTVKFEDWSTNDMKLIPLEDCIETSRCRCRIPDVVKVNSIEAQYYWIVSNYKNKTQYVEDEIVPYMTVVLQPPKFEVSIDITRTVLIKVKERQAARKGSKITLVDALYVHHHYPNYVVKYWSQGNDTRLVKKFDADNSTSISFPLEDVKPNENVCFCMSLEATIYDSKDCSSPGVCLKVPASGDFGRILTMCGYVLVFILILVSIAAAYKVTRRFQNKVQVFKQNSIPTSLMNTIREEKKTKNADEKFIQYSPFDKNVELYDLSEVNVEAIQQRRFSSGKTPTSYYSEQKESSGSSQSSEEESGSSGGTLTEELTVSDAPQKDQFNVEGGSGVFTGYIQIPLMGNDPPMSL